jgi:D-amino peptidase
MKVLISVDMEGVTGVTAWSDVTPGTPAYERFRHQMTAEANAAVAGAFDAGASSVVVNDSHGRMRNLLYEELDGRASLVSGPVKPLDMVEGVDGAHAAVFIGYHAMAGSEGGTLAHTMTGTVQNWLLNGVPVGEAQINAALCGHFNVPVVLVSGDARLAEEVAATLPSARRVVVKWASDQQTARSRPANEVLPLIRDQVKEAVVGASQVLPVITDGPVRVGIEFVHPTEATAASLCPRIRRTSGRTVEMEGATMLEAYQWSWVALELARALTG